MILDIYFFHGLCKQKKLKQIDFWQFKNNQGPSEFFQRFCEP